jgi:ABC-type antimicrobial peptide transport system permease subunit
VIRAISTRSIGITVVGSVVGGALAFGLGRVMQSIMFGLVTTNVVVLLVLMLMLASAAMVAAYVPARRVARIDPMSALRES